MFRWHAFLRNILDLLLWIRFFIVEGQRSSRIIHQIIMISSFSGLARIREDYLGFGACESWHWKTHLFGWNGFEPHWRCCDWFGCIRYHSNDEFICEDLRGAFLLFKRFLWEEWLKLAYLLVGLHLFLGDEQDLLKWLRLKLHQADFIYLNEG